jgi:hypothetical protein
LLHQALFAGLAATSIMFGPAFPAWEANTHSVGGSFVSLLSALHAAQAAETTSLERQQPPPGPTIASQVHNAPGWQPSHSYASATGPYTRVVSGPGWNPANGTYIPGEALNAYQLVSAGTCTSASSGGPSGPGSSIKDGTCTWKYLSNVDYISITGWAYDNRPWKSGTVYTFLDYVTTGSPLRTYALLDNSCTSTVAPTGNDLKSKVVTSDGCQWQYKADIIYTSRKSFIPTETATTGNSPMLLMLQGNYEAQLWNDREYVAGQNGDLSPIRTQDHNDYRHEGGVIHSCTTAPCYHIVITTAPGESFRDNLTSSDPLTGYDPTKGVAIRNSLPPQWPYEASGFDVHDNYVDLIALQIKSVHGAAINGLSTFGNVMTIRDCILEGGGKTAAVTTDTSSLLANSLVISHAPMGVILKYPGFVLHSTIVTADHTPDSVGIETDFKWFFDNTTVSNTAIFGFTHAAGHYQGNTFWSSQTSNNMTDAPPNDSGTIPWPYGGPRPSTIDVLPGTTYGVTMERAFIKPGSDWRPSSASPLHGAGSAFGTFAKNCDPGHPSCTWRETNNVDTPDIIGVARPQAGRYDIGAW